MNKQKLFVFTVFFSILLFPFWCISQSVDTSQSIAGADTVYSFAEKMPVFPGGESKMYEFIDRHIVYPQEAVAQGIEGKVFVSFVIERTGTINDVTVLRGLRGGCNEAAINVIRQMPSWEPGKQNGKIVRVKYVLPIQFKIDKTDLDSNERMASFPGGEGGLFEFLRLHVYYPPSAMDNHIEGKVYVSFVVDSSGEIKDAKVDKGIGGGCDEIALNVVSMMPRWNPAMLNGKAVSIPFKLPIGFFPPSDEEQESGRVYQDKTSGAYIVNSFIEQPSFPGGEKKMNMFIEKNIIIPDTVKTNGIQGSVAVKFIVEATGIIDNIKILNGLCKECDEEAIRLVKMFPRWIPGSLNFKIAAMEYNILVPFYSTAKHE